MERIELYAGEIAENLPRLWNVDRLMWRFEEHAYKIAILLSRPLITSQYCS